MNVGIAYGKAARQIWLRIDVPEGSTVRDVIEKSGVLDMFPEIDLETQKVGLFGKICELDRVIGEGERVEIYREITADPELVERVAAGD